MKIFSLAALLCALVSPAGAVCLDFDWDIGIGTVGSSLMHPDGELSLLPYDGFFGGIATIVMSNTAQGDDVPELNLNAINFRVQPTYEAMTVTFNYGEPVDGTSTDLMVNEVWVSLDDLSSAPTLIGGALVTVTRVPSTGPHNGAVTLTAATSTIKSFAVGGQWLFVDDVCW